MGFQFRQFHILDSNSAMKVGTDAVLLGSWADVSGVRSVLDVGAGSAILSLMIAQRTEPVETTVTAVEIDSGACIDAAENISKSIWNKRIELVRSGFSSVAGYWDLIISNPPFFSSQIKSPSESRARARHAGDLNYLTLISYASRHLNTDGSLAMISDLSCSETEIIFCAEINRLKVRRLCRVFDHEGGEHIRTLWQFRKTDGPIEKSNIAVRTATNDRWSEEYKKLTCNFYLDTNNDKSKQP